MIYGHIRVHAYPIVYTHSQPLSNYCYNVFVYYEYDVQLATLMQCICVMSLLSHGLRFKNGHYWTEISQYPVENLVIVFHACPCLVIYLRGLVTCAGPTLKVRRFVVHKKYATTIETLYRT